RDWSSDVCSSDLSTNTINLQEQLVVKDLPCLRRALGEPFRFALVKGRRNYVSIRRARLAVQMAGVLFEPAQQAELEAITSWLKTRSEERRVGKEGRARWAADDE